MAHAQFVTCHGASHETVTIVQRTMIHKGSVKLLVHMPILQGVTCSLLEASPTDVQTLLTVTEMSPVSDALIPGTHALLFLTCVLCVSQGVLYSHRSNFLHAMAVASQDVMGLSSTSCFYAIVPLFHANSWGLVFAAPMTGARLVLPGQSVRLYVCCGLPHLMRSATSDAVCHICCLGQSVSLLPAM